MSERCLLLKSPRKTQHYKVSTQDNPIGVHVDIPVYFRYNFRMRMRVLSLPACPDWRKVRVGTSEKDEMPSEWEMEQIALDKLKLRRQQSLSQRHLELIRLRQQVMAESMEEINDVTNVDFMNPPENEDFHSSIMFQRTTKKQSLSMQNLVEFGRMEIGQQSNHAKGKTLHLSNEKLMEIQRTKKLERLRSELDDFRAIYLQMETPTEDTNNNNNNNGGRAGMTHNPFDNSLGSQRFRGSKLTLVSFDESDSGQAVQDITYCIQNQREKELRKMRQQNLILEYRLKQQWATTTQ